MFLVLNQSLFSTSFALTATVQFPYTNLTIWGVHAPLNFVGAQHLGVHLEFRFRYFSGGP